MAGWQAEAETMERRIEEKRTVKVHWAGMTRTLNLPCGVNIQTPVNPDCFYIIGLRRPWPRLNPLYKPPSTQ
jgi:hypothetical protein